MNERIVVKCMVSSLDPTCQTDETTLTSTSSRDATRQAEARLKKLQEELRRREDADRAKARRVIPPSQLAHNQARSSDNPENPKPQSPATPPKSSKPKPKLPVDDDASEQQAPQPQQRPRPPVVTEVPDEATELKKAGNEALEEGDYELAAQLYTEALQDGASPFPATQPLSTTPCCWQLFLVCKDPVITQVTVPHTHLLPTKSRP